MQLNFMIGLLCLIWGFNWVFMKLANLDFPPATFAAWRFVVGSLVLLGIALFRRVPLPRKADLKWIILCGFLQTTYFNIAIQISLNGLSAGLTSVLTYSMPLWLALMAHFLIPGERLTVQKGIGVLFGIVGLMLAMDVRLGGSFWAFLLALSSGLSWAVSNVIIKRKLQHCDNVQFTTWQMATGSIGLILYSVLFEHGTSHWGWLPVLYILFAGIVASAVAFLMWFRILAVGEAGKASLSLLLVPIIGVLSGCLVLGERLQFTSAIGILLVIAGIGIVNKKSKKRLST